MAGITPKINQCTSEVVMKIVNKVCKVLFKDTKGIKGKIKQDEQAFDKRLNEVLNKGECNG